MAAAFFYFNRKPALTDKDTILLADFTNTTGDAVFDGTLKQALAVHLGQSPFLNIFADERVRETLRLMNKSPDERVTPSVGREICQRQGLKALLTGTIASLGRNYVINLEAVNGQTGDVLARGQAYLGERNGAAAASEFQKILDHRGWSPLSPLYPLAHLGLARAAMLASDTTKARKSYQDFFALWKDADADLPVLIEAMKEYEKLK